MSRKTISCEKCDRSEGYKPRDHFHPDSKANQFIFFSRSGALDSKFASSGEHILTWIFFSLLIVNFKYMLPKHEPGRSAISRFDSVDRLVMAKIKMLAKWYSNSGNSTEWSSLWEGNVALRADVS